jgi:hypothetical protein
MTGTTPVILDGAARMHPAATNMRAPPQRAMAHTRW